MGESGRFFTVAQAARYTGQSQQEIFYLVDSKRIRAAFEHSTGLYRIPQSELDKIKIEETDQNSGQTSQQQP